MTLNIIKKSSIFRFISETIGELKKVHWLSKPEIAYLTFLVLIVAIVSGLVLGAVDYGFTQLVNEVFVGR
jgi:preprotein translocase SecE subunit